MSWLVTVAVVGFSLERGRQLAHDQPPPPTHPPSPPSPPSPPPTSPPHAGCDYNAGGRSCDDSMTNMCDEQSEGGNWDRSCDLHPSTGCDDWTGCSYPSATAARSRAAGRVRAATRAAHGGGRGSDDYWVCSCGRGARAHARVLLRVAPILLARPGHCCARPIPPVVLLLRRIVSEFKLARRRGKARRSRRRVDALQGRVSSPRRAPRRDYKAQRRHCSVGHAVPSTRYTQELARARFSKSVSKSTKPEPQCTKPEQNFSKSKCSPFEGFSEKVRTI